MNALQYTAWAVIAVGWIMLAVLAVPLSPRPRGNRVRYVRRWWREAVRAHRLMREARAVTMAKEREARRYNERYTGVA